MSEPDLKCGVYEGRSFIAPDDDTDVVAYVGGERLCVFEIEIISTDSMCEED